MTRRTFLFLQGPPGPFFAGLAGGLGAVGHRCLRVNFNGGDRHDWRGAATDFTGSIEQWPQCLSAMLWMHGVTDIVLFGDCRPVHRIARIEAERHGVDVHVFEEGYLRPDWITIERGGVNGYSALPRDPGHYLARAAALPALPPQIPIRANFRRRAIEAIGYFSAVWRATKSFPRYHSHRPSSIATEAVGWLRRLSFRPIAYILATQARRRFRGANYFLLPLQLDADHQIRTHSRFDDMRQALAAVIASFAADAPSDMRLVVKEHPLDNGLQPWRRLIARIARSHAIADRIHFLEHGDLDALVARATGVVTVNSTSGTLALAAGRPVKVLGDAVYDIPGITDQKALDAFWRHPTPPQSEIFEAFRRVLVARCLLRGGFSSVAGRAALLPAAIERLCRDEGARHDIAAQAWSG